MQNRKTQSYRSGLPRGRTLLVWMPWHRLALPSQWIDFQTLYPKSPERSQEARLLFFYLWTLGLKVLAPQGG